MSPGDFPIGLREGLPDISDWNSRRSAGAVYEGARRQAEQATLAARRLLAQAVVPFDALTGDPHWDYYLSLVEAKLEERRKRLAALQEQEIRALTYDHASLACERAMRQIEQSAIDVYEEILALPKRIRDEAEGFHVEQDGT